MNETDFAYSRGFGEPSSPRGSLAISTTASMSTRSPTWKSSASPIGDLQGGANGKPHPVYVSCLAAAAALAVRCAHATDLVGRGGALDHGLGEHGVHLASARGAPALGEKYEARFPGAVRYVWDEWVDIQAGEQVFRVPRRALHEGDRQGDSWRFRVEHVEWFYEVGDYDPEAEIDYDGEDDDG